MKRLRIGSLGAGLLLLLLAGSAPALAARDAAPDRRRELRDAIGEASAEEAAALGDLGAIRERRRELDSQVAGFDARIAEIETVIAAHQADIDRITAEAVALDAQAAAASAQLETARRRVAEAAAAMYRGETGAPVYADVLDVDNLADAVAGTKYLTHLSAKRRVDVASLAGLKLQIEELRKQAEVRREEARAAREQAQNERNEIAELRAEQQVQRDAIVQEEQRERALVASIHARKDKFTAELSALQAASNAIGQTIASRSRGQARANSFQISRPVPGPITGSFGARVHPILGTTRIHSGVDMQAGSGQAIKAAAAGVVAFAGVRGGYGNTVVIDHGNQFATLYAHASALRVSNGQRVQAGQVVALVGSTGLSSGPHLHFEVRLLGDPVDPAAYM